ncbi:MAG TPA: DNA-formamidopyrimidine glycosylase family protein, partial [Thermoanaerobaculia bacterium]
MPELPDVEVYLEALRPRIVGQPLEGARISSPFLLRTVEPALASFLGRRVEGVRRLGKRVVIGFEGGRFAVLHLMISGRLQWKPRGAKVPGKIGLAAFDFPTGTLLLTEAGSKKRASLHLVAGEAALAGYDPGGLEVLAADLDAFRAALTAESHTLKRALTDPHLLSGIGNSYSDEILHRARLSPFRLTRGLGPEEMETLFRACREVLSEWTARLRAEAGDRFPDKVTAHHPGMAVHGRFGQPCPVCGTPVQRLVYADSEANYCPTCQTGGRLLADRALSLLLKKDWPKTLEELEARKRPA